MKRVLFVIPSLEVGGTLSSLLSIIENLSDEFSINILSLSHDGYLNSVLQKYLLRKSFLIHACYCNYSHSRGFEKIPIGLIKLIKRFLKLFNIDLEKILYNLYFLHYQQYDLVVAFQEGMATKYVSYMSNRQKLAWIHCDYRYYSETGKELNIYSKFDSIICVSYYTASSFSQVYPSLKENVQCVYNILNIDYILKQSNLPLNDTNFNYSQFTIISVGRIDNVKRFEYIPKIANTLKCRGCIFKWYIIGPPVNATTYQKLLLNIKEYNVDDCVVCLGAKQNPYPYFKKANLLVSLSYTEACPMIFNEAKILNLPIVSTNFGSSYEFVKDGEYGVIAPLQQIEDVLESLILDNNAYKALVSYVKDAEYDNDCVINKLKSILNSNIK